MSAQVPWPFTDIHCHLLPAMDDGSPSWSETLAMARLAAADGTGTIIVTPHQLGNYSHNGGDRIRQVTNEAAEYLRAHDVPVRVLPGADVRIDAHLVPGIRCRDVVSLADHGKHVLLELPHELYFALQPLLRNLARVGITGILSHPERNRGLLAHPERITGLVDEGCLMQITAGSVLGSFGRESQRLADWMLRNGLAHFVASDAHGSRTRRPLLSRAFTRVAQRVGRDAAVNLFCRNPAAVAEGRDVPLSERPLPSPRARRWFGRAAAG